MQVPPLHASFAGHSAIFAIQSSLAVGRALFPFTFIQNDSVLIVNTLTVVFVFTECTNILETLYFILLSPILNRPFTESSSDSGGGHGVKYRAFCQMAIFEPSFNCVDIVIVLCALAMRHIIFKFTLVVMVRVKVVLAPNDDIVFKFTLIDQIACLWIENLAFNQ
jgi:hypothetical protein